MSPNLMLGERGRDGMDAHFKVTHVGTTLDWRFSFGTDDTLRVEWATRCHGEWGLRFWVMLCVSGPAGTTLEYDRGDGRLYTKTGSEEYCLVAAKDPLLVTAHDNLASLERELNEKGYFYLDSRATTGSLLALRFNLEEAPTMRIEVGPGATPRERPTQSLAPIAIVAETPLDRADYPLQAMHDVIAWNHVFDEVNQRPYTVLTRFWNTQKFGGFGVWMNDVIYNAWMWGLLDLSRARENLEAVFAWQTEAGNFPCLVTGHDQWLDRSQPPIVSFVVWSIAKRHGDQALLASAYDALLRNHDWWWRCRRAGDLELVVYGTSPGVGDGLYKGTKLGAKNESSMDNMAVHDDAPFDASTGLLMSYDVGLNALLALDGECLEAIARQLGRAEEAARLADANAAHKAAIGQHLWDHQRGVFANRLVGGGFVDALAPTSFFPLVAGIGTATQVDSLIANHLEPADKFGGWPGLPSAARDHPAYGDNVYWRGRVWAPLNLWTYQGLRRAGRQQNADKLARDSWRLFATCGWQERLCGENYNAQTGAIRDQPDTDSFYSWGALLAALPVIAALDVTPWEGLRVARPLGAGPLGPLASPIGAITLEATSEALVLRCNGEPLLETSLLGLEQLEFAGAAITAQIPAGGAGFVDCPNHTITRALFDGEALTVARDGRIHLPERIEAGRLCMELAARPKKPGSAYKWPALRT